jgi:hypothetical protein
MTRRAWLLLALAVPGCSRPPTRDEAAGRLVGTWHFVRENGELREPPTGQSGLVQFAANGTVIYEVVGTSAGQVIVKPATGRYRVLDGETLEVTGADGSLLTQGRVRAVFPGERLTLQVGQGPLREFERVK